MIYVIDIMIHAVELTEVSNVPLSDFISPAAASWPAELAAIVKPRAPANKFVSAKANAATPVTA